jgi:polyisoprenoid-binding protein YceI
MKTIILGFLCAGLLAAADQSFDLDPAKTNIAFTVHDTLHTVHGTFKLKRGNIRSNPDTGKASGEIVIDVASGQSGSGARDKRMQKEILESSKYPEAAFTPDRVEGHLATEGASQIDVHGKFTIHGAEHELTMHFEVQANGHQYTATTHFAIPYIAWGMKNPSNFLLKVDDKVEMEVNAALAAK